MTLRSRCESAVYAVTVQYSMHVAYYKSRKMFRDYPWQRNEFENTRPPRSTLKITLVVPLHFLALKVRLVVLVNAFVMVSTVWSVSCLLFFYSRCPSSVPSHL